MKIITTTANDFFKQEVAEYGWDYVDDMFAQGYEPTLINGIWAWGKKETITDNVLRILSTDNVTSDNSCTILHSHSNHLSLIPHNYVLG